MRVYLHVFPGHMCRVCGGLLPLDGLPCDPPIQRLWRRFLRRLDRWWFGLALIGLVMTIASVVHAKGRLFIKEGFVADVRAEPDPTAVMVLVTSKFTALSLEQESAIANEVCTTVSVMSQKWRGDAGSEGVGLCDLVLAGTDNVMGSTHFDDEGRAVTEWRLWYLRSKQK